MARIGHVLARATQQRDETRGYPVTQPVLKTVEVRIDLTAEEAALLQRHRPGRTWADLLGPAQRWECSTHNSPVLNPYVLAHHSALSNPYGVHAPHLIAERTLDAVQKILRRLAASER